MYPLTNCTNIDGHSKIQAKISLAVNGSLDCKIRINMSIEIATTIPVVRYGIKIFDNKKCTNITVFVLLIYIGKDTPKVYI